MKYPYEAFLIIIFFLYIKIRDQYLLSLTLPFNANTKIEILHIYNT